MVEVIVPYMPAAHTEENIRTAAASRSERTEKIQIPALQAEMPPRYSQGSFRDQIRAEHCKHFDIAGPDHLSQKQRKEQKQHQQTPSPEAEYRFAKPLCNLSAQMLRHTDLPSGQYPQIGNFLPLAVKNTAPMVKIMQKA